MKYILIALSLILFVEKSASAESQVPAHLSGYAQIPESSLSALKYDGDSFDPGTHREHLLMQNDLIWIDSETPEIDPIEDAQSFNMALAAEDYSPEFLMSTVVESNRRAVRITRPLELFLMTAPQMRPITNLVESDVDGVDVSPLFASCRTVQRSQASLKQVLKRFARARGRAERLLDALARSPNRRHSDLERRYARVLADMEAMLEQIRVLQPREWEKPDRVVVYKFRVRGELRWRPVERLPVSEYQFAAGSWSEVPEANIRDLFGFHYNPKPTPGSIIKIKRTSSALEACLGPRRFILKAKLRLERVQPGIPAIVDENGMSIGHEGGEFTELEVLLNARRPTIWERW